MSSLGEALCNFLTNARLSSDEPGGPNGFFGQREEVFVFPWSIRRMMALALLVMVIAWALWPKDAPAPDNDGLGDFFFSRVSADV